MALEFDFLSSAFSDSVRVVSFRGAERLSTPYRFDVYVAVSGGKEIDLADSVGSKASLLIRDGVLPVMTFGGVIASLDLVRAMPATSLYLVTLVPRLWQLSLTKHSRVFTKKSIPDVIEAVLQDEGITDFELRLTESYEVEEHVTQYKESSLDFLHRWMEREGIYYFFEQTDSGEVLVITDNKAKHDEIATGAVRYNPTTGQDWIAGRHFDNFTVRTRSLPANVKLTDFDYVKPSLEISGSASVSPNGFGQVQEYGSRFFTPAQGARLARIRAEELRASAATFLATGAALGIYPGYKVELEDHPHGSLNQKYLVVSINHTGYLSQLAEAWGSLIPKGTNDVYRVELTAISADTQYRHPVETRWPRIDGFENGFIDGPAASEYAQIDDHGRYCVKFKFDEGTLKDGKASTFVRMAQPHAGGIEGWHFPLRKGTEVIFIFLSGDPDRPVISAAIPNAHTPSPVTSGNHTRNVIQTGGRNRLEIEDLAGMQRITLSTPHANSYIRMGSANDDHEMIVKTDMRGLWRSGNNTDFDIKGHWWIEVDKDKREWVTGKVEEKFKATKLEEVPNGLVTEKYHSQLTTIAHTYNFTVTEETTETYTGEHKIGHGNKLTETVTGKHTLNNDAGFETNTKAGHTINVKTGSYGLDVVEGDYKNHTKGTYKTTVDGATYDILAPSAKGTIKFKEGGLEVDSTWNELVKGDHLNITINQTSELLGGMKNEYILGLKTEGVIGLHSEINIGGKVETFIGLKISIEVGGVLNVGGLYECGNYPLRMKNAATRVENWMCWAAIGATTIMQGIKLI